MRRVPGRGGRRAVSVVALAGFIDAGGGSRAIGFAVACRPVLWSVQLVGRKRAFGVVGLGRVRRYQTLETAHVRNERT